MLNWIGIDSESELILTSLNGSPYGYSIIWAPNKHIWWVILRLPLTVQLFKIISTATKKTCPLWTRCHFHNSCSKTRIRYRDMFLVIWQNINRFERKLNESCVFCRIMSKKSGTGLHNVILVKDSTAYQAFFSSDRGEERSSQFLRFLLLY